jgi:hypothetical protein
MERERENERWGKREIGGEKRFRFAAWLFPPCALSLLLSVSLSFLPAVAFRAAAHKFHFSFTQIEYNAKEKTVEITLRVFADDLEQALSKRSGKAVKLEQAAVAAYLRETVELKSRDGRVKKLTWIGMEAKVDVALLYVEAKVPEGMAGLQLRQRVFFELFADQVNQVLLKSEGHKTSLDFKPGEGFKVLSFGSK